MRTPAGWRVLGLGVDVTPHYTLILYHKIEFASGDLPGSGIIARVFLAEREHWDGRR